MKLTLSLLAISALASGAFSQTTSGTSVPAAAPSPTPPVFEQINKSPAEKIADAKTYLSDPNQAGNAVHFLLGIRNYAAGWSLQDRLALADRVFSDPSISGLLADTSAQSNLLCDALLAKLDTGLSPDDALALIAQKIQQCPQFPKFISFAAIQAKIQTLAKAKNLAATRDYDGVIQLLDTPAMLGELVPGIAERSADAIFAAKVSQRAPDALAWARAKYYYAPFQNSQAGINAVASALRAADMNLVRSNAFIQFQKDAQGANVLDAVVLPDDLAGGPFAESTPAHAVVNALLKGDRVGALKIAFTGFITAQDNPGLNAAVSLVAQTLRNVDGNLVRANAFVTAQKAGQPFDISELK